MLNLRSQHSSAHETPSAFNVQLSCFKCVMVHVRKSLVQVVFSKSYLRKWLSQETFWCVIGFRFELFLISCAYVPAYSVTSVRGALQRTLCVCIWTLSQSVQCSVIFVMWYLGWVPVQQPPFTCCLTVVYTAHLISQFFFGPVFLSVAHDYCPHFCLGQVATNGLQACITRSQPKRNVCHVFKKTVASSLVRFIAPQ